MQVYIDLENLLKEKNIRRMLPERPEDSNKGSYGRLLVIAGGKGMQVRHI
mgnify:CR=1 FL=1